MVLTGASPPREPHPVTLPDERKNDHPVNVTLLFRDCTFGTRVNAGVTLGTLICTVNQIDCVLLDVVQWGIDWTHISTCATGSTERLINFPDHFCHSTSGLDVRHRWPSMNSI